MSFAIIETGGKQYKVSASNILKVERLNITKGNKVEFKKVLLVNDDKTTEVGNPTINGAMVEGLLLENIKDKKIIVFKKRRRQNSRKKYGHRQLLSKIQITKILKGGKIVSEIKSDKKSIVKNEKETKKTVKKKTVIKTKNKK
jgi:large subunit ribosomal protein L21